MSEPTLSEQLLSILTDIWEAVADVAEQGAKRFSWILPQPLETRGYPITGGADDDGQIQPVRIEAEDIDIDASNSARIARGVFPFLISQDIAETTTLSDSHNGALLWYTSSSAGEILLWDTTNGGEIEYVDDGEGGLVPLEGEPSNPPVGFWVTLRCAQGAANCVVKVPTGHEVDGDTSDIPLISDDARATVTAVYMGGAEWRTL